MSQWMAAVRQLRRRPAYALAAVSLLGMGIGLNTILFSLAETILLRPLPYPDSDQLVTLTEQNGRKAESASLIAPPRLEDWNRLNQTFSAISANYFENVTDTSAEEPERLMARRVIGRFFDVYGTPPAAGRTFREDEVRFGGPNAAVISYTLWARRFNRDSNVTSKRLILGGQAYSIVGVMPKTFGSATTDLWLPAPMNPYLADARDARFLAGIGRVKPGVTIEQALDDLKRVQTQLAVQYPKTDEGWTVAGSRLKARVTGAAGSWIWMLFGAAALLLCIACANVSGLLIGQLEQRRKEMAIRMALGAGRGALLGLVLREVACVAVAGAVLGAIISAWGLEIAARLTGLLPRIQELEWSWRSLAFSAVVSILTTLLVGLLPGLRIHYAKIAETVGQAGGRSNSGRTGWFQRALLLGQIALTVVLLSSAGLLLRSYWLLTETNTGFDPHGVLTFHVGAEWSEDRNKIGKIQQQLLAALGQLPNVEAAGFSNFLPAEGADLHYQYSIDEPGNDPHTAGNRMVAGGYFKALRIPLLAGTGCPDFQKEDPLPQKVLVNRSFNERYGQGQNLVGRKLINGRITQQVAGLVGDLHEDSLRGGAAPYVYTCSGPGNWPDPGYVVRYSGGVAPAAAAIRQMVHQIAPGRAVFDLRTLDDLLSQTLDEPRLTARLLLGFALFALLLAAFGLYSILNLAVTARRREIGVRMALGARAGQVLGGVMADAGKLLLIGLALGALGSLAAAQILHSRLYGVAASDPVTIVSVVAALSVSCFVAAYLPARRAASTDPMESLRSE